jgi:hypothetical protein
VGRERQRARGKLGLEAKKEALRKKFNSANTGHLVSPHLASGRGRVLSTGVAPTTTPLVMRAGDALSL